MEATERLVQTWMVSGRDEVMNQIVSDISCDKTTLVNVVKALGEYLTSEESHTLHKGVELLALVVTRSSEKKLNQQSVRVLSAFFIGKLGDTTTIKPALTGLSSLAKLTSLAPAEVASITEGLFQHVKMKAIVQDVRFKVFTIIDSFMAYHRDLLKSMGFQFISGYISLAEGEKDPRNLMVAFAIARVILIEFDISDCVESMFNILFCYFPITFRPPPNDKYGITTVDLRLSLRKCLGATPAFGPLAIPVFLEKLSAGSRITKQDTLQTLGECLPLYGSTLARVSAQKLWNALKLEIFLPVDAETAKEALRATHVLIQTIYVDEEAAVETPDDVQGLARDICEECLNTLKEPEKSQARPATKILCTLVSTTPSIARYTISQAVPHFCRLFHNPDEFSSRPATLSLLTDFLNAIRDRMVLDNVHISEYIGTYRDEILGVLTVALSTTSTRNMALAGLEAVTSARGFLSEEELLFIAHKINQIIEENTDELGTHSVLEVLISISVYASRVVAVQTLPLLFSMLPDKAPSRQAASKRTEIWQALTALQGLCVQQELFESLVICLTTKLDILCFPSLEYVETDLSDPEPTAGYAHMILKTLEEVLVVKTAKKHTDIPKYIDRLVPQLFNLFIASAFQSPKSAQVAMDTRVIEVAANIITIIVQSLPIQRQQTYSVGLWKAIFTGNFEDIAFGFQKIQYEHAAPILDSSNGPKQRNLMALWAAVIIALHKEVGPVLDVSSHFLDMLVSWVLDTANNEFQKNSALHIIASILNKHADQLDGFLSEKLLTFWTSKVLNEGYSLEKRLWSIKSWIWITKALVVCKHPLSMTFTERIYDVFEDESIGWDAARAIGEIVTPDTVLTKANHAEIKVLSVQKHVNATLPKLTAFAGDSSQPKKQTAALVALTSMIKVVPRATYANQMASLIPLLLRGLDLPDVDIRSSVIDTLLAAAEGESPDGSLISEHSPKLVNYMIQNSKITEMTSTKVRIAALRYLAVLPNIVRYDILHPYKAAVLRDLAEVLDDPKKSVRKEAVDARTKWFKYKG